MPNEKKNGQYTKIQRFNYRDYGRLLNPGKCEMPGCGVTEGIQLHFSRTAYCETPPPNIRFWRIEIDLTPEEQLKVIETERRRDPNAPSWYCADCRQKDEEFWNSQWEEYYQNQV